MIEPTTILLIEDDPDLLATLAAALTKAGHAVFTATDGRSGMKLFAAKIPFVVVTDIVMPTQEGIETIMAMKAARPAARIVAMSGGGRISGGTFLQLALQLGADRVIAKPFRPAALVALVNELISLVPPVGALAGGNG